MYYKLGKEYALRGWDKMAWALVRRPGNDIKYLKREEFETLLLCDGKTNFDAGYITDKMKNILQILISKNIVEACIDGKTIDEEQSYHYYDNRYVRHVYWTMTGKCNFRCRHCYLDAPNGAFGELSHEQAMRLIDQMAECGVLRVKLSGGEPFVRKDFWTLVDRLVSHKIIIDEVYTNGWFVDDSVLDEFEKRNLKPGFNISFDGVGWHDWMRGVNGAEDAALKALALCSRRGFDTGVEMCIHRGNQDTLPETVRVLASIGVKGMKTGNVSLTNLWKCNSEGNALSTREYIDAMLRYIPSFFESGMPMDIMLTNVIVLRKNSTEYRIIPEKYDGTESCKNRYLCNSARYSSFIAPDGSLAPCMPMMSFVEQGIFPKVQEIGLKKGLSDGFYMDIVNRRIKDLLDVNEKCAACGYKYKCGGGCRAIALEQTGDLMGCDESQCFLWKEGYVDRIREEANMAIARYCTNQEESS